MKVGNKAKIFYTCMIGCPFESLYLEEKNNILSYTNFGSKRVGIYFKGKKKCKKKV